MNQKCESPQKWQAEDTTCNNGRENTTPNKPNSKISKELFSVASNQFVFFSKTFSGQGNSFFFCFNNKSFTSSVHFTASFRNSKASFKASGRLFRVGPTKLDSSPLSKSTVISAKCCWSFWMALETARASIGGKGWGEVWEGKESDVKWCLMVCSFVM